VRDHLPKVERQESEESLSSTVVKTPIFTVFIMSPSSPSLLYNSSSHKYKLNMFLLEMCRKREKKSFLIVIVTPSLQSFKFFKHSYIFYLSIIYHVTLITASPLSSELFLSYCQKNNFFTFSSFEKILQ